ncbi:pyridoxal-phosphate dependent enzyme [Phytoactinopolyspora alkaliphila]|uniref:Pyridoxal-phosphate dependent enzyme n=1 Tax=Phytoactinopolyspora alkaliphila TaxID=1783498 RepID=A0A6N9YS74_9ACTN|nr:pyridoxal-phosphate dependent enzyme [Phytoactinopolyspora alkaliphila]NED97832.1 pyridoxal-phosphate dependent enzyme [Phytoactinopolyspora alkaliphila]
MRHGMWRYADRLPVVSPRNIVSLGEGGTPVLDLTGVFGGEIGVSSLVAKAEDRNPTGSFKARIASVAYSLVKERGQAGTVGTSSGNGGAAAAAYAAAAGSRSILFTLADTVPAKMAEILAMGATACRVDGVGHDAVSTRTVADMIAAHGAQRGLAAMLTAFHYAPEAMLGVSTIAFELAEQEPALTAVYVPVGGGGLLTGIHQGYLGTGASPRLVGVQPTGSAALQRALSGHPEGIAGTVKTTVSGLQMAALYDVDGAVSAIRRSGGHTVEVSDAEIWAAQRRLARCGLLVEPAGATALAGLIADARTGALRPEDRIAILLTGAGYKDRDALRRLSPTDNAPVISPAEIPVQLDAALRRSG